MIPQSHRPSRSKSDDDDEKTPLLEISSRGTVLCPSCNDDSLHLALVETAQGSVSSVHSEDLLKAWQHEPPQGRRGSFVGVSFSCETCLEVFELGFQFHKGSTQADIRQVDGYDHLTCTEMWRD